MKLPLLSTPRLLLRPFVEQDLDALHALWTDADVRCYLWDDQIISRERAAETLRDCLSAAESHAIGQWAVYLAEGGPVIGAAGFQFIAGIPDIELMGSLRSQFWGRGLAAEAARACLEYLWSAPPFPRVFARADPPNERSIRLMERLGMSHYSTGPVLVTYVKERPAPPRA